MARAAFYYVPLNSSDDLCLIFRINVWVGRYVYLLASVPAILLTILLFMDQQITSVIVNRKEHKLKVRDTVEVLHSSVAGADLKNRIG